MSKLADQQQRDLIRNDLDSNMVVEAAAGTGKTSELVRRIIALIENGRTTVDRLVAVTFTEKAAGELKLRLRMGLEDARREASNGTNKYRNLRNAVARLEEARVSTIHGFCADLLRERSVEARVDPDFKVLTEEQSTRLFDKTFHRWLQAKLEDPPDGLRRSLRRASEHHDDSPSERLRRAAREIAEWRDHAALWRRAPFDRETEIDTLIDRVHQFADLTRECGNPERDMLYRDTAAVRQLSDEVHRFEQVRGRDYDGLESALIALLTGELRNSRTGYGQFYAKDLRRDTVVTDCDDLKTGLKQFQMAADADLAAALQGQLFEVVEVYEDAKQRAGYVDFLDLLLRARNLVRDCELVRADFQKRFSHLLVDEFQDTDPLQAEILLLLASKDPTISDWRMADPVDGKLFIVGDPKQSIYRFRRADVGVYLEVKSLLEARGAHVMQLSTSFRSVPSIQHAVNHAFAQVLRADAETLQASYVPLSPFREEVIDQPTVIALPVPAPYGKTKITKAAIEKSLPDAVAAFVQWLLYESGWSVTERDDHEKRVPIGARHVCLLFRRFQGFSGDITRGYVQALEARGIPHLMVGGRSFHTREEVEMMRAALSAIEWPDDELSLFATLHGSLFAIGDAALLQYRHRYGRLHPFRRPKEAVVGPLRPIVSALELLADLHRQRNLRPVSDTIGQLLAETRSPAGLILRPSGEQVLANVLHVAELARAYEQTRGLSFRGFVDQLLVDAERGESPEALILEEGSDGVRIMTTHKAKGLEFPVVILADITANPTGRASRYVDSDRGLAAVRIAGWSPAELLEHAGPESRCDEAEGLRLAYVAATRARDILVVPAVGDEPFDNGWISCLNPAIYPPASSRQRAKRAPGCPEFGHDTVLARNGHPPPDGGSVEPGLHVFTRPNYGVVWWDPKTLALNVPRQFGIRQEELLGKMTDRAVVEMDLQRYRDWESSRASAIGMAAQASLTLITATQHARTESPAASQVEVIQLPRRNSRPGGMRFGALVHAMLATVSLRARLEDIEQVAGFQTRILGALPKEREAAVEVVAAALRHPLLVEAADAADRGECRRETPVTLRLSDGSLVEGAIDLAFTDGRGWRVIDFKTDRELEHAAAAYKRQVALYAEAIRASTGKETLAVLLVV